MSLEGQNRSKHTPFPAFSETQSIIVIQKQARKGLWQTQDHMSVPGNELLQWNSLRGVRQLIRLRPQELTCEGTSGDTEPNRGLQNNRRSTQRHGCLVSPLVLKAVGHWEGGSSMCQIINACYRRWREQAWSQSLWQGISNLLHWGTTRKGAETEVFLLLSGADLGRSCIIS